MENITHDSYFEVDSEDERLHQKDLQSLGISQRKCRWRQTYLCLSRTLRVPLHSGRIEGREKEGTGLRCWQMFVEGRKSVHRRSKGAPKAPSACSSMHAARMASPLYVGGMLRCKGFAWELLRIACVRHRHWLPGLPYFGVVYL